MLRRLARLFALSSAFVALGATPVLAGPAIAAIGAFAATPIGGFVTNLALGFLSSAVGQLFRRWSGAGKAAASGIRGTVGAGGDLPISWLMGYRATAGSYAYRGSWGTANKTPNAYYVEERILSDLPMPELTAVWVNDKKVTVDWGAPATPQGQPIVEGRVGGKDHWWIKYYDGNQTTPDAYMLAKFGAHPDHPYDNQMIGRGQAKVIFTALVNRDLMTSWPKLKFESTGIRLYDVSLDSTAGGDGPQRRNDPSTWQPSSLLPVLIYNIVMGIRYQDQWVWGCQDTTAAQLPASTWIAAIAEARASTATGAGGTEPQFTGGLEVSGDMEPHAVIAELLKGCNGRMAELGGIYKMVCGVPPSSVFSFTDRDIVVSREQGYDPYPRLDNTINAIRATYPEPAVGWANKDAPARYSTDLEAEDNGRRLPTDVRYDAVYSPTQVQRLMKAAIEDARRFRRHAFWLPPEASELEPLDVVSWTSDSQGYASKKFLITETEDEATYLTQVSLQEIDPADYDYDPDTDELPWSVGQLDTTRPEAQQVSDWAVTPYTHLDSGGNARRPGIKMYWDGDQADVRALLYQVRLAETGELALSGEFASAFAAGEGVTPPGSVLSAEDYEVRAKYDPFSARPVDWTTWLPVTTPNVPELSPGAVKLASLDGNVRDLLDYMSQTNRELVDTARTIGLLAAEQNLINYDQVETLRRSIKAQLGDLSATFDELIEVAIGPGGSIATALSSLYAGMGGNSAQVNVRWQAVAAPGGYSARYAIQAAVNDGTFRAASFFLDVPADPDAPTRIVLDAGQTIIRSSDGADQTHIVLFDADGAYIPEIRFNRLKSIATTIGGDPIMDFDGVTGAFTIMGT